MTVIQRTSLRTTLSLMTVVTALLALAAATTLFILTSSMERASAVISASVESVRLLNQAEVDLLVHARAGDAIVRREIEGELQWRMMRAEHYVASVEEGRALEHARLAIQDYLRSIRAGDPEWQTEQSRAFDALKTVVDLNVAQAKLAEARTARWDHLANIFAVGLGVAILAVAGALVLWLRSSAFRPIFALARVMERFGAGDRTARAREDGPLEVRSMSQHFNAMADRITAQQQRQMIFLGGVAHDLRSPLSALSLSLATYSDDAPLPPEARLRRVLSLVKRQVLRMDRLIGDFLDTAKIEAGELDLRFEVHDVATLVRQCVALFEGTSERHTIVTDVSCEARARVDAVRLEQVIANLLSNAIRYSPNGGEVRVSLARDHTDIVLRVSDDGVGIPEEERLRLFAPFQRVGPLKDQIAGVGLGLFVARRIIEAHHGRIDVESVLGRGTTFSVTLPCDLDQSGDRAFAQKAGVDLPAQSHARNG
jgi:signal transduction histidine kinase